MTNTTPKSHTENMGGIRHTQHTKKRVIDLFSYLGRVDQACEQAGVDRSTHYAWLKKDPAYKEAFQEAREPAGDALEDEAVKRAMAGSDTLLIFLLKGARPERYRERYDQRINSQMHAVIHDDTSARELLYEKLARLLRDNGGEGGDVTV